MNIDFGESIRVSSEKGGERSERKWWAVHGSGSETYEDGRTDAGAWDTVVPGRQSKNRTSTQGGKGVPTKAMCYDMWQW